MGSDESVVSELSEYSGLPASIVSCAESEPSGETLGSTDSTRSIDGVSDNNPRRISHNLSFVSHSESVHESPVIQAFVRQNDKQDLRLYKQSKQEQEPWKYPSERENKCTKFW